MVLSQQQLKIAKRNKQDMGLIFTDLDNMKWINDTFGHAQGDAALQEVSQILSASFRESDIVARIGGDEFAMVLFADYPQACSKATQVLRLMETKVSIGISTINPSTPDGLTVEEFILHADNALYEAKNSGRGRAVVDLCSTPDSGDCQFPCLKMANSNHG